MDVPIREKTLWTMLYETAARSSEVLALDVEDLDRRNRRSKVTRKGSTVDVIVWQTGTARLLPRLLDGHTQGPVFLTERRARVALAAADVDPDSGRARLSYRRAEELFTQLTRPLAHPDVTDPRLLAAAPGWRPGPRPATWTAPPAGSRGCKTRRGASTTPGRESPAAAPRPCCIWPNATRSRPYTRSPRSSRRHASGGYRSNSAAACSSWAPRSAKPASAATPRYPSTRQPPPSVTCAPVRQIPFTTSRGRLCSWTA